MRSSTADAARRRSPAPARWATHGHGTAPVGPKWRPPAHQRWRGRPWSTTTARTCSSAATTAPPTPIRPGSGAGPPGARTPRRAPGRGRMPPWPRTPGTPTAPAHWSSSEATTAPATSTTRGPTPLPDGRSSPRPRLRPPVPTRRWPTTERWPSRPSSAATTAQPSSATPGSTAGPTTGSSSRRPRLRPPVPTRPWRTTRPPASWCSSVGRRRPPPPRCSPTPGPSIPLRTPRPMSRPWPATARPR